MRDILNKLDEVTLGKYGPGQKFFVSDNTTGKAAAAQLIKAGIKAKGSMTWIDMPKSNKDIKTVLTFGRGNDSIALQDETGQIWIAQGTMNSIATAFIHDKGTAKISNKGDVAEGILGAAMFAKFIKRESRGDLGTVTPTDISNVLNTLKKTKRDTYQTTVHDANSKIADTISFMLKLKTGPYMDLMDQSKRNLLANEFSSAAAYVNSPMAERYSKYFYLNGKADEITVMADGAASETEKKSDVWVAVKEMDGKLRTLKLNASLKVGGETQFGQVGGSGLDSMVKLWAEFFGVDISSFVKKYTKLASTSDQFEALAYMYKSVAASLAKQLLGDDDTEEAKFVDNIAHAVTYFATLGDPNVELVDFDKGGFKILRFKNLKHKLRTVNLTASYLDNKSRPEISIHDIDNPKLNLINIRVKLSLIHI